MLPRVDGWDFLAQAKADSDIANIPVIIVSILDERGKGIALGAAEYLVKPVDRDYLLDAVHHLTLIPKRSSDFSAKVLVIDDDLLAIELVEAVLQPEGYTILRATNGEHGIALAQQEAPSMIILDLLMPGIDGFAVVEQLRASLSTASIPIIVLTAKTMTREEKERLNGQISLLAQKAEFNRAAFVASVRAFVTTTP
jgi:CheY-like chemotaxis protein